MVKFIHNQLMANDQLSFWLVYSMSDDTQLDVNRSRQLVANGEATGDIDVPVL